MSEIEDMGSTPESDMVAAMWPGGVQPVTDRPIVNPFGGSFSSPVRVSMTCATEGASIAYTTEAGDNPHWLLYFEPVVVHATTRLRTKAIRYGYHESEELALEYSVLGEESQ
jgi:hypothetical protein